MPEWPWRYRSRSKVVLHDTPSHASDHLCLIWIESIQNCRRYRADTACGTDGRTDGRSETNIPPNNFVVRGYKNFIRHNVKRQHFAHSIMLYKCQINYIPVRQISYSTRQNIQSIKICYFLSWSTYHQTYHHLSALLQLHLHFKLNTWLHWIGQKHMQDETGTI